MRTLLPLALVKPKGSFLPLNSYGDCNMGNRHIELLAELEVCETRIWEALVLGDKLADSEALHTNFLGVYSDGFAVKADHVRQLEDGPTIENFELSDCRVLPLGHDFVVFSYRADFLRKTKIAIEAMYVSSIWQRSEDGWTNVFSQDTPAID